MPAYDALNLGPERLAAIAAANQLPRAIAAYRDTFTRLFADQFRQIGAAWKEASETGLDQELDGAMQDCAQMVLQKAQELSGKRYFSLSELRRMGHPYAVRYGSGAAGIPDFIVNLQSGRFAGQWQVQVGKQPDGQYFIILTNTSRVATYLFTGTSKMRQRDIIGAAFAQTQEARDERLAQAVRKADP